MDFHTLAASVLSHYLPSKSVCLSKRASQNPGHLLPCEPPQPYEPLHKHPRRLMSPSSTRRQEFRKPTFPPDCFGGLKSEHLNLPVLPPRVNWGQGATWTDRHYQICFTGLLCFREFLSCDVHQVSSVIPMSNRWGSTWTLLEKIYAYPFYLKACVFHVLEDAFLCTSDLFSPEYQLCTFQGAEFCTVTFPTCGPIDLLHFCWFVT